MKQEILIFKLAAILLILPFLLAGDTCLYVFPGARQHYSLRQLSLAETQDDRRGLESALARAQARRYTPQNIKADFATWASILLGEISLKNAKWEAGDTFAHAATFMTETAKPVIRVNGLAEYELPPRLNSDQILRLEQEITIARTCLVSLLIKMHEILREKDFADTVDFDLATARAMAKLDKKVKKAEALLVEYRANIAKVAPSPQTFALPASSLTQI